MAKKKNKKEIDKRPALNLVQQVEVARLYITGEKTIEQIHSELHPDVDARTLYRYTENPDTVSRAVDTLHGVVAKTCLEKGMGAGKTNAQYMKMLLENIMRKGTPADKAVNGLSDAILKLSKGDA
jgi:uncharacterized protein YjaG (DUF416 family)